MYTTCGIYNQVQCKQYNKYINFLKYKSGVVYIIIIYTYSSLKRIPSFPYHFILTPKQEINLSATVVYNINVH